MGKRTFVLFAAALAACLVAGCGDVSSLVNTLTTVEGEVQTAETSGGVSSGSGPHLESGGLVVVEAEHFTDSYADYVTVLGQKVEANNRHWYIQAGSQVGPTPDPDGYHGGGSGDAYVECLPDTRVTHADPLGPGSLYNSAEGGSYLEYEVDFETTGTYYVWVRAYSSGTEDNGIHVGLDGDKPSSGAKVQVCGQNAWKWSNAQRDSGGTACGVNGTITVQVTTPGVHVVSLHQREDGFELDRFLMTTDPSYVPGGAGPRESDRTNP